MRRSPVGRFSLRGLARLRSVLILAVAAALLAGCRNYPEAVRTYEFLDQYERMSGEYDPYLSLAYVNPEANLSLYRIFIIGNVGVGKEWVEDEPLAQRYGTYFRKVLEYELAGTGCFDFVVLDRDLKHPDPTLRMEAKITLFDTGSGVLRFASYFAPWLQKSAASDLQVEARVYDTETGEIVAEFADRRRHLGNTPWGPTPSTFKDDFVMKHTVIEAASAFAYGLKQARFGSAAEPAPAATATVSRDSSE